MEALLEFYGDKRCPICGKRFTVMWPHQWAFKRGKPNPKFYCSWKCLRTLDKENGDDKPVKHAKVALEDKKKAVEIALAGGDPLKYLKDHGAGNAWSMWYAIKENLKIRQPETYRKLPDLRLKGNSRKKPETEKAEEAPTLADAMTGMKEATDDFFGKCEEMGLKMDNPEKSKITKPVNYDGFNVRAVEGKFGSYHFQEIGGKQWIDYENKEGADELSMTVDQWRGFIAEIREAARVLGVEL